MKHVFGIDKELSSEEVEQVSGGLSLQNRLNPGPTTLALGEEGGDGRATTLAVGEEGGGGRYTTMAVGEEGGSF
mgnify:CR=1 FL=1